MIKFFSKYLAKKWLDKHKNDTLTLEITQKSFSMWDMYQDMGLFLFLYILGVILLIIGGPILVLFLSGYSISLTLLSFIVSIIIVSVVTTKLISNYINVLQDEIMGTLGRINSKLNEKREEKNN
jgi:ABC-type multidrug transport system fused ATPase/permease subunit